jgi:uncharacterized membrane protein YdfJ with MMPL/SSD domain
MPKMWWTVLLLAAVLASPGLLTLFPAGYDWLGPAHLIVFVVAVVLLARVGRLRRRQHRPAWRTGFWLGAATGIIGAVVTAALQQTPTATQALVVDLASKGVPEAATLTMVRLHLYTSVALTCLMAAGAYGVLGAFAAWWGSLTLPATRPPHSEPRPRADPST